MSKNTINRNSFWDAAQACGLALLLSGTPGMAQSAKVAKDSLEFKPDTDKKELAVGFRLVDDVNVTSVRAATEGKGESVPATWEAWDGDKVPACAWMIVVDTSDPTRLKTVAKCVELVRSFVTSLPNQDKVAVFTLARDLSEVLPFGSAPDVVTKGLTAIKPAGDASQTTLIHSNLRNGLERLVERKEPRKAVLLLTDGQDQTPGGAAGVEIEKKKLIEAAKSAGIVVHAIGYAESGDGQKHFAALKDLAAQTDGLFEAAALKTKEVPAERLTLLRGVMHGAGTVHVDVKDLKEPAALTVTVKTAAGKTAALQVPSEMVAVAKSASPAEIEAAKRADEEAAVKKATEDKKIADEAAAKKADEDKKTADAEAAAKKAKEAREEADKLTKEKDVADKAVAKQKKIWIGVGSGVVVLALVAVMMVRASRKRAAEKARMVEEERLAEEEAARRAEVARRKADETKIVEAPPLAWLEMCDAQQTRHPVRIPSLKIGRGQHNDFVLPNDSVSGNHCVLNCNREKEWSVTDLNSGNGVILNGSPVKQAALRHGDVIELGELKMRFLLHA